MLRPAAILIAALLLVAACDDAKDGELTREPTASGATPTFVIETPDELTPIPATVTGRADCPQTWAAYDDPGGYFSLCYPDDWGATVSDPQAYFGHTLSLRWPDDALGQQPDSISLTVYWSERATLTRDALADECASFGEWEDGAPLALEIAGQEVLGCAGDATQTADAGPDAPPLRGTYAEFVIANGGGVIVFFLTEGGTTSHIDEDPLAVVLDSLKIGQ